MMGPEKPKSASNEQKEELVRIFEEYRQKPKAESIETDNKERQRFWIEATHRLNQIQGGTMKPTSKWVKYWADVIINLRRKFRLVAEGRSKRIGPSSLEVRILRAGGCYDLLEQWTKAIDPAADGTITTEEEYYPEDTGVQKEEIVVENYTDDPLDDEFVASFSKPIVQQTVTTELDIRKPSLEELKSITEATSEYVEMTATTATIDNGTSEFLRPKVFPAEARLKESLKRTTEKLETVMKKRKIDDSKYVIAQALTNMSSAMLALSNGLNDLANALTNDSQVTML